MIRGTTSLFSFSIKYAQNTIRGPLYAEEGSVNCQVVHFCVLFLFFHPSLKKKLNVGDTGDFFVGIYTQRKFNMSIFCERMNGLLSYASSTLKTFKYFKIVLLRKTFKKFSDI